MEVPPVNETGCNGRKKTRLMQSSNTPCGGMSMDICAFSAQTCSPLSGVTDESSSRAGQGDDLSPVYVSDHLEAMEAGRKQSAARRHMSGSILSVGLSRGISLVAIAVTNIAITRMLGASGIGTVSISAALLFAFAVLFEVGLSQGTAYYAARSEWSGRHLASGTITACLLLGTAGTGLMLLAYSLVGQHVPGMTWTMAIALAVALPF